MTTTYTIDGTHSIAAQLEDMFPVEIKPEMRCPQPVHPSVHSRIVTGTVARWERDYKMRSTADQRTSGSLRRRLRISPIERSSSCPARNSLVERQARPPPSHSADDVQRSGDLRRVEKTLNRERSASSYNELLSRSSQSIYSSSSTVITAQSLCELHEYGQLPSRKPDQRSLVSRATDHSYLSPYPH